MCMLIDANLISVFFNRNNERHKAYKPALDWIIKGRAKIVLGGGRYYQEELKTHFPSYLSLFTELSRLNKTHWFPDKTINELTIQIRQNEQDPDFDDPHIIALLCVSKAKIFCSEDERSFRFVKDKKFYPERQEPPKIFSLKTHESALKLLSDENICSNGPHVTLPETISKRILDRIESGGPAYDR